MKKFLAIYLGVADDPKEMEKWNAMSEEQRKDIDKRGMEAWGKWAEKYKDAIVDNGTPIGKTKRTDARGVSDTKNAIAAYTIVQAETHDEAAKMFLDHPHFTIWPGKCVETMAMLPMPKM